MRELHFGADGKIQATREGFAKFQRWHIPMLAQIKLDGMFGAAVADSTVRLFSRTGKEKTNEQLFSLREDLAKWMPPKSIVVGELGFGTEVETRRAKENGYHRMVVYDIIKWDGEDFTNKNTLERFKILEELVKDANSEKIELVETHILNKLADENRKMCEKLFSDAIKRGEEGLMLKEISLKYKVGGERTKQMYKIKKILTKDYVIIGFDKTNAPTYRSRGLTVSAMRLGLFNSKGELVPTGATSAFDLAWRKEFSTRMQDYIGVVVEVGCYEVFSSGAPRSAWFIRLRPDKLPQDCTFSDVPTPMFNFK